MKRGDALAAAALVMAAMAVLTLVPYAHWTSIWADRDFTGWVAPIANRLSGDERLYDFGLYSPIPPLSFIFLRLTNGTGSIWITEAIWNYIFIGVSPILLYAAGRRMGFTIGQTLFAAVATFLMFLGFTKSILYDSQSQLCVSASILVFTVRLTSARSSDTRLFVLDVLVALITVLSLLTKQSSGVFLAAGILAALALSHRPFFQMRTLISVARAGVLMVLFAALVLFALRDFISPSGFFDQVLRTGSEVKGGSLLLVRNLGNYAFSMGAGLPATLALVGFVAYRSGVPWRALPELSASRISRAAFLEGIVLLWLCSVLLALLRHGSEWNEVGRSVLLMVNVVILDLVLLMGACSIYRYVRNGPEPGDILAGAPSLVGLAAFSAAIGHNLSVSTLRWTQDTNALIFFAWLFLAYLYCRANPSPKDVRGIDWYPAILKASSAGLICGYLVLVLIPVTRVMGLPRERWPEIAYLEDARMPVRAGGMRDLVAKVREWAPDRADVVALLPEDPNVQAWFDRPRPHFSSAIIFVDQYWDRNVDLDYHILETTLPKIIIVGPRDFHDQFLAGLHDGWGSPRLIGLVKERLLQEHYELKESIKISYRKGSDWMDIYVRR